MEGRAELGGVGVWVLEQAAVPVVFSFWLVGFMWVFMRSGYFSVGFLLGYGFDEGEGGRKRSRKEETKTKAKLE